ncbi:MAG TPA: L,D-transpeptidase family protein [Candidatus Dormibacteraeota bacterium]|nr:L,D-transpeptidase family protein [Candidatus Dormibacteraeota bacterium]
MTAWTDPNIVSSVKAFHLLLTFFCWLFFCHSPQTAAEPLADSRQALVVLSSNWETIHAEMVCFERPTNTAPWQQTALRMPVVLGRNGMGWGLGLHQTNSLNGPLKHEGDGKSPAGIFLLPGAFGYDTPAEISWLKMPYVQCTSTLECVDDSQSRYYNQTLERPTVSKPDWNSSEQMRRKDEHYHYGIFVAHNQNPAIAGRGSCIFIHLWEGPAIGTSGCTAMDHENILKLLHWLDSAKNPLLIQMPTQEYEKVKSAWVLP